MFFQKYPDFKKPCSENSVALVEPKEGVRESLFCGHFEPLKNFELNAGGYVRNEIARIREETDIAVANNLIARLTEIHPSGDNAGKTDAEILLGWKSKYLQTPSEMVDYIESYFDVKLAESQSFGQQVDGIKFDETDNPENNE